MSCIYWLLGVSTSSRWEVLVKISYVFAPNYLEFWNSCPKHVVTSGTFRDYGRRIHRKFPIKSIFLLTQLSFWVALSDKNFCSGSAFWIKSLATCFVTWYSLLLKCGKVVGSHFSIVSDRLGKGNFRRLSCWDNVPLELMTTFVNDFCLKIIIIRIQLFCPNEIRLIELPWLIKDLDPSEK